MEVEHHRCRLEAHPTLPQRAGRVSNVAQSSSDLEGRAPTAAAYGIGRVLMLRRANPGSSSIPAHLLVALELAPELDLRLRRRADVAHQRLDLGSRLLEKRLEALGVGPF